MHRLSASSTISQARPAGQECARTIQQHTCEGPVPQELPSGTAPRRLERGPSGQRSTGTTMATAWWPNCCNSGLTTAGSTGPVNRKGRA
eukprot:7369967-Alexandrium_andersonii.AAC.1